MRNGSEGEARAQARAPTPGMPKKRGAPEMVRLSIHSPKPALERHLQPGHDKPANESALRKLAVPLVEKVRPVQGE